ncbi:MAG TPA: 2Fe-2S iron-sulfur cluster-binding protein [Anaeromyxobacteraceae bacterium]|jgi:NADH-quinone oxidoreductase subunit G
MADSQKPSAPAAAPRPPGPPPAKHPGFVTCTVDGREVVARPGTLVIQAARQAGIEIPHYCWHEKLSVAANCRMCLVEMSNSPGGKLQPACQAPVGEGVAVRTDTPRVKDQQRATLEFLLLNHPVDCPICDQAGECKLQDYYMSYDRQPSRLDMAKQVKGKRISLGPTVTLDQERCILCTRCVRFMREVAKAEQLGVARRGSRSVIVTFPGQPLDHPYAGNVVDICPVGALTSTDFRFRGRVWFMSSARSVCTGCSRGCNVHLDFMGETAYRLRPRVNEAVNSHWMCDGGRLTYKSFNEGRLLRARLGRGEGGREAGRAEAVAEAARQLRDHAGRGQLAALLSPTASLEDLLAACRVARGLGLGEVYAGGRPDGTQDDFLKRADENPDRRGLELAAQGAGLALRSLADLARAIGDGKAKALWAVGAEVPSATANHVFARLEAFVCQATNQGEVARAATVLLPAAPAAECDGTFVSFEGRAQRFERAWGPRGEARPHWALAAELGRALGQPTAWTSAREVFQSLGSGLALGDFRWDLPPAPRARALEPPPAGTVDGRLPGYREREPAAGGQG